ncbi:orexin/Hypocretin receptor type 1-like [Prorops nasuta]|uniref:orexin/Hypocretin receptor type 1-like n=1 Tax=Prorops nasuta TaxID=863751 RepID=UPI0034CFAD76
MRSFMNILRVVLIVWPMTTTSLSIDANDDPQYYVPGYDWDYENMTTETTIEDLINYVTPKLSDWILIVLHTVVFVVGLVGNSLVCIAVYRNHSMRNVTNYFIVNLAIGDLMVILICLPPTVLWDVTETWFLGLVLCKIIPYLQTVSVCVSVLTLTFISIDRWYAICFPLRFKSTPGRAKVAIVVIWVIALLFDTPELLVLSTYKPKKAEIDDTILLTQCGYVGWAPNTVATFLIIKFIVLYIGPLLFMSVAYWQIVRVLWRNNIPGHNLSTRMCHMSEIPQSGGGNPEGQLKSRRKAAKMLVAVVLTFALCCLTVHVISIVENLVELSADPWLLFTNSLSHWLYYLNSALNPVIYNFMSGKFRKEFKRTFRDCKTSNIMSGRRPTQMSNYTYTANGYRPTLQARREPSCHSMFQLSRKRSRSIHLRLEMTETNFGGSSTIKDNDTQKIEYA